MIWDMNAEELITIANKRLCKQASEETRQVVKQMCVQVIEQLPEFKYQLVPNCVRNGGECHEFKSCKENNDDT
jgi:thymidylate synthase ThyX